MRGARTGIFGIGLVLAAGSISSAAAQDREAPAADGSSKVTVTTRAYDTKQLLNVAVPEDVYRGRTVWLQRCAYCHDGVGQPSYRTMGPWLGAETVQNLGEDRLKAVVANGTVRMPGFRYTLQAPQVNDLIAFLKTISSDQKPTPEQLNGRSAGPEGGGD
jgi:mono/diheme cytochrome c family protein